MQRMRYFYSTSGRNEGKADSQLTTAPMRRQLSSVASDRFLPPPTATLITRLRKMTPIICDEGAGEELCRGLIRIHIADDEDA